MKMFLKRGGIVQKGSIAEMIENQILDYSIMIKRVTWGFKTI